MVYNSSNPCVFSQGFCGSWIPEGLGWEVWLLYKGWLKLELWVAEAAKAGISPSHAVPQSPLYSPSKWASVEELTAWVTAHESGWSPGSFLNSKVEARCPVTHWPQKSQCITSIILDWSKQAQRHTQFQRQRAQAPISTGGMAHPSRHLWRMQSATEQKISTSFLFKNSCIVLHFVDALNFS